MSDQGLSLKKIDPTLDALAGFEGTQIQQKTAPRHFTIRQTWMANDAYRAKTLKHLLTFTRPPVPGLFYKTLLKLYVKRFLKSGKYRKLASKADFLQLKLDGTRLRAFFLPGTINLEGLCVKIIPKESGLAVRTRQELSFREKLTELGTITLPRILNVTEDDGFLYISEELIQGTRYRNLWHATLYANQGIPELCATYKSFDLRMEPVSEHLSATFLTDLSACLGSRKRDQKFLQAARLAVEKNPLMPIGTCHNDLLPSNICVSNGQLYFFDWELVAEGSILTDLLKLPFKYRLSDIGIKAAAQALKAEFPLPAGTYQDIFTLYVAERIVGNSKRKAEFLEHWHKQLSHFK